MLQLERPKEQFKIKFGYADWVVLYRRKIIGDVTHRPQDKSKRGNWVAVDYDGNWTRFTTRMESVARIYHRTMTHLESIGGEHGTQ